MNIITELRLSDWQIGSTLECCRCRKAQKLVHVLVFATMTMIIFFPAPRPTKKPPLSASSTNSIPRVYVTSIATCYNHCIICLMVRGLSHRRPPDESTRQDHLRHVLDGERVFSLLIRRND